MSRKSRRKDKHSASARQRMGRRLLSVERLEERVLLTANSLGDQSALWFADLGLTAPAGASAANRTDWVVQLSAEAATRAGSVAGAAGLLHDLPIAIVRGLGAPGLLLVSSFDTTQLVSEALAANPLIASFTIDAQVGGAILPNDPLLTGGQQYGLLNPPSLALDIDAEPAWSITTGSLSVVTAVIDSGVYYTHPDLYRNIWINQGEIPLAIRPLLVDTDNDGLITFLDLNAPANASRVVDRANDGNSFIDGGDLLADPNWANQVNEDGGFLDDLIGWDFRNNDNNPLDDHGHGTHVAGTIGAIGNNNLGGTGINWATSLMPLKFLDQNNVGSVSNATAAINYATMMRTRTASAANVKAINASWGGAGVNDPGLESAIRSAGSADVLFVAAAGNGDIFGRGQSIDTAPYYPASFNLDNMLVVAATDRFDNLATFSNFGAGTVDLAAPGVSIYSTDIFIEDSVVLRGDEFSTRSGTSMAAPLVTGTAALAWASAPTATLKEVRDAILSGGDSLASLQGKVATSRRLNALGALNDLPPQAKVTSALDVTSIGGVSYQFTVSLSSNVGIQPATVGAGDFIVRRQGTTAELAASLVSASSSNSNKQWTVTYQITPPGGIWDVLDGGTYEILLVGGALVDTDNAPSQQKVVDRFEVNLSNIGVFRPTVFTDGGAGSLREAITLANAVTPAINPAGGTIILAPGVYSLSLTGSGEDANLTGDLDITGRVTIASSGLGPVTIQANGIDRVLDVRAGGNLTLEGVTVTGGYAVAEDGGGIRNTGALVVTNSTIEGNSTTLNGGGIFNAAGKTSNIAGSSVSNNTAAGSSTQVLQLNGSPTMVNTTTAGGQYAPSISTNASGEAVIAWNHNPTGTVDLYSSSIDVYAQRLNPDGTLDGPQFQADTSGPGAFSRNPAVVLQDDGDIGFAYEVDYGDPEFENPVFASFDENVYIGGILIASQHGSQFRTQITQTADGNYLLVWSDVYGYDGSGYGTFARTVNRAGTAVGPVITIPDLDQVSGDQLPTGIARMPSGEIMVVFHDLSGRDGSAQGVFGRMLDSSGTPIGSQFQINETFEGAQWYPRVSASSAGFVVTWSGDSGLKTRLYNASGIAITDELPIANTTSLQSGTVSSARLSDGSIVIVWDEYANNNSTASTGSPINKVWMQRYDSAGAAMTVPQLITSTARFVFQGPRIAADLAGNATIVWDGSGSGDSDGIYMQRISLVSQALGGEGGGIYNAGTITVTQTTIDGNDAAAFGGGLYNAAGATSTVLSSTVSNNDAVGATVMNLEASGGEFRVSQATGGDQYDIDVDINGNGRAVVTWTTKTSADDQDVFSRILDGLNVSPSMSEFQVNPSSPFEVRGGAVGVRNDGSSFVSYFGLGFESGYGVRAQLISSAGSPGAAFTVPQTTAGDQVVYAMDSNGSSGRSVVVWSDNVLDGSGYGVFARVFDSAGLPLTDQFSVNQTTANNQLPNDVVILDDGTMLIVWHGFGAGDADYGVFGRRFNSNGTPLGPEVRLNSITAGQQSDVRIAKLATGYAAVWSSRSLNASVQGQLLDENGALVGPQFEIGQTTVAHDLITSVTGLPGGGFVVAWPSFDAGSTTESIMGRVFDAGGAAFGPAFVVYDSPDNERNTVRVGADSFGNVLFVWAGNGLGDDFGVMARRYTPFAVPVGGDGGGIYNAGTLNATNATISGNDAANQGGGIYNATGATATIESSTVTENTSPRDLPLLSPDGAEFRVNQATAGTHERVDVDVNSSGRAVVTWTQNFGGTESDVFARVLDGLTPNSGVSEFQVNPAHTAEILDSDVGVNEGGGYMIGYMGWGLGNGWGVRVVNYSAANAPSSAVSPSTASGQIDTAPILSTLTSGDYVAGWRDEGGRDGSGSGYLASVFDANGNRIVNDFLVNQSISGNQATSDVVQLPDGTMLFVWWGAGAGGTSSDIYGRRFSTGGVAIGDEFRINSNVSGDQTGGDIAVGASGVVITWTDRGLGRIAGQRLTFAGTKVGAEFDIANITPTDSGNNDVVVLPDGSFVVVWSALNSANGTTDVFAREYAADGTSLGTAYVLSDYTAGTQWNPRIDRDAAGNVLIVWQGEGSGDGSGIFAKRYTTTPNASGVFNASVSAVTIRNSIVANNGESSGVADVFGAFVSQGGNLIGNVGAATGFSQSTDQTGITNPQLAPLADYGSPTKTHLPLPGSPAIDKAVAGSPITDQRGVARPADGDNNGVAVADVGAVERYHASISGRKFNDLYPDRNFNGVRDPGEDPNGVHDVGEVGIAGWTMYLDLNTNGQLDAGEPTSITNAQGDYAFIQLAPGTYTVAEVNQPGWTRTYVGTNYGSNVRNNAVDGLGTTVTGLSIVHELAISPDGLHAYAINTSNTLADSIVSFRRNAATGDLEFVSALTNDGVDSLGIEGEGHVVVSPDGKHVYALGSASNAVAIFNRNLSTGALTFVARLKEGDEIEGDQIEGLVDPRDLVLSPNGEQLYIVSSNAVVPLTRNATTGLLSYLPISPGGGTAIAISPNGQQVYVSGASSLSTYSRSVTTGILTLSNTFSNGQPAPGGGMASALTDVADIVISPDGKHLYTHSRTDQSIGLYERNLTTGVLKYIEKVTRGVADSAGTVVDGLNAGKSLAISPAGDRLYATADGDESLAIFRRDASTGRLTYLHVRKEFGTDGADVLITSLNNPDGVVVSPDGSAIYVAAREGTITRFKRDSAGLDRKVLLVGQELTGVNSSSFAATGEIRGTVYSDLNNNGLRDADETGLAGVTVYLDLNNSNTLDGGDESIATDQLGEYKFSQLTAPRLYNVRFAAQSGQTVTSPSSAVEREWSIALDPDEIFTGANFLVFVQLSGGEGGNSQISGFVWQDLDGEGDKDANEPFWVGRQVYLDVNDNGVYDSSVDVAAPALTGANGQYLFTSIGTANVAVRVATLPGETTSNLLGNFFNKQTLTTGVNPLGLEAYDLNNDNRLDLVSVETSSDTVSVRLQLPDGTFAPRDEYQVGTSQGSQPTSIAVGRFNNDLFPDLAIVYWSLGQIRFLTNDGNGTFTFSPTAISIPFGYTTIVAGDFVPGGLDDLAVAIDGPNSQDQPNDIVRVLQNNSVANLSFSALPDVSLGNAAPLSLAAGRLNGDTLPDLVVGNYGSNQVRVLLNNGGTSFTAQTPVTLTGGVSAVVVADDLTGDGQRDVVATTVGEGTVSGTVVVLSGNGTGLLTVSSSSDVSQGPRAVAVADVDGDLDLDLVVGRSISNDVVLLRKGPSGYGTPENSGLASFASLTESGVKQVIAADFDNNGLKDLAAVRGTGTTGSLEVLKNSLGAGAIRLSTNGTNQFSGQNFGIKLTSFVPGDYDRNGTVSQADRTFWATHFGTTSATGGIGMQADGNGDNVVDAADYTYWRDRFTASAASATATATAAVTVNSPPLALWLAPVIEVGVDTEAESTTSLSAPSAAWELSEFWFERPPSEQQSSELWLDDFTRDDEAAREEAFADFDESPLDVEV